MKYRPSKRVVWLIIPLAPVVVMLAGMWYAGRPDTEAIANRGAKAPPEKKFSLASPGSWGVSAEWFGDGMDALMSWDRNPWKQQWKQDTQFGKRLLELQDSDRPEDKAELERLRKLGKEWYERILARYPELVMPPEKEIPREENGFLQWTELVTRLREKGKDTILSTPIPREIQDHFRKKTEPDMASLKAWVNENRTRIEEIRAIGLLPGQSAAGMGNEVTERGALLSRDATNALLLDARAAVAEGDMARALESIRAANGLADHLSDTGASSVIYTLVAASMRAQAQNYVVTGLLPSVPGGSADLAAWQAALNPTLRTPSQMANSLRSEWNMGMPRELLPILSDSTDPGTPRDADHLAEIYTRHMQALAQQADGMSLADYAASARVNTSTNQLSRRSRDLELVNGYDPKTSFLRYQESTGLTQAAFAVLNGQPVPNDPIYGLPYKWNPVKRELALPEPPGGRSYKPKPLKLPKM